MRRLIIVLSFMAVVTASQAANKYLRQGATGTGSGNDWTNAYTTLSALQSGMARGDVGYVADSTTGYAGATLNKAQSGSTLMTIKKATVADHGTSTGWLDSYGDGQALFTSKVAITTPNWVFDGVTGGGPTSWTTGYGFKIQNNSGFCFGVTWDAPGSNVTIRHTEIEGNGGDGGGSGEANDGMHIANTASNFTASYVYIHDVGRCLIFCSADDVTIEYLYGGEYESVEEQHAEAFSCWLGTVGIDNMTVRWSVFTFLQTTGGIIYQGRNLEVYGCVFVRKSGTFSGQGAVGTWSADIQTGTKVYNCSFIDIDNCQVFGDFNGNDSGDIRNNVFYSNDPGNNLTHDYNHYVSSGGTHSEANGTSATTNPFVDYFTDNFALTANTTAGQNLGAPYNVDMFGNTRSTWTRGAIEFSSGDTTPPSPDPMTFSSAPEATGQTSIAMTATTATDSGSPPVEYFFDETSGNPGGSDSAWQSSASYTDTGLNASTQYTYRVKSRDSAGTPNETAYSSSANATTTSAGAIGSRKVGRGAPSARLP